MANSGLEHYFERYLHHWQQALGQLPVTTKTESSPANAGQTPEGWSLWRPIPRDEPASFDNVASALEVSLHPALTEFYGHYFAGEMSFESEAGRGELLQVWNEDDFAFLQENLIGHLVTKQRLKQKPTLFIGLIDDDVLVLDNEDGSVWLEKPGQDPHCRVADSLTAMFDVIQPVVVMPSNMDEQRPVSQSSFGARVKTMLSYLGFSRRD